MMRSTLHIAPVTERSAVARPSRAAASPRTASLARVTAFCCTLAALLLLCGLQLLAMWRAPAAWMPSAINIRLHPGERMTLGQHELAAPQADQSHLSVRRDPQRGWMLQNLSAARQVLLLREGSEQRLGSIALAPGQRFQIDGALFEVTAASTGSIAFARAGHSWRYDGAALYHDGRQQDNCPEAHLSTRMLAIWNRWAPAPLTIARPLSFGGNLHCDNRLGLANVTPGAAQIARHDGRLELSAGAPDGERAAIVVQGEAGRINLRQQEAALEGVQALVVGHTRFQLTMRADQLTLTPSRHITLFKTPELKLPEPVSWDWHERDLWAGATPGGSAFAIWIAGAACIACAFAALAATGAWSASTPAAHRGKAFTGWRIGAAWLASASVLVAGIAALVAPRSGMPPPAACSTLLAAMALMLWLILPGRLSLVSAAGLILLSIGLLAQLELGLAAPESSWLRYYQKSAALLAIGTGAGGGARIWFAHRAAHGLHLQQRSIEWSLVLLAALALAALAAQVLWGDETGVFDLQPVELAKLALAALTAHCLALRFSWRASPESLPQQSARWLHLIAPALLFLALLGFALVQVDDFSPLILLLVWATVMGLAYALAARNRALLAGLITLAASAAAAILYLRCSGADELIRWGFYADRFLVWLNPGEHPHTGQQLLLGARAIAEGDWWGADHLLGLHTLGQSASTALHIPAVQDDFAASFFLNRHGLVGGLLLWAIQATLLIGCFGLAARARAASIAARDFRAVWAARFRYFALCGGAAFVLGHLLLSWGTNLAIFPIMGQPMSFLSAGGSHLLFFLCPLLTFAAVSAQSLEEK